jgi:hypothetical protein
MRWLVVALALAVSPFGAVVCEVACSIDEVAHDPGALGASEHHGTPVVVVSTVDVVVSPVDDDHECSHPEGAPAVLTSLRLWMLDLPAADLPSTIVFRSTTTTIARSVVASVAWSPPQALPPALPLRI